MLRVRLLRVVSTPAPAFVGAAWVLSVLLKLHEAARSAWRLGMAPLPRSLRLLMPSADRAADTPEVFTLVTRCSLMSAEKPALTRKLLLGSKLGRSVILS